MSELSVMLRLTQAFINTQPASIVITQKIKVPTATGGYVLTDTPLPVQTVRFIEPRDPVAAASSAQGGESITSIYELLAMPGTSLPVGGTFMYDGGKWEIIQTMFNNNWETRVLVNRYGS